LQFGPIVVIDLKVPPRPPGYAFIEVSMIEKNIVYIKFDCFVTIYFFYKYDYIKDLIVMNISVKLEK
jgi:hypothetical protein